MEQHQIVEKLMELYGYNHLEYRYMYINKEGKPAYAATKHELTYTDLYEHLDGKKTVSVYGRKYHTKFMTIDVDESDKQDVYLLINKMVCVGIPRERIYVSLSGNKGYHLDVFFDGGVLKSAVENMFEYLCRDPEIRQIDMECFPLRHNTIKIPLGVNLKTGRRCWYANATTLEPYVDDYEFIMGIKPMSASEFGEIVYQCNKKAWVADLEIAKENAKQQKNEPEYHRDKFTAKGEPVITMPGQRHRMMCKKAVYLRSIGADEETICRELMAWIDRQDQTLIRTPRHEIEKDAEQIAKSVVAKYGVKVQIKPKERNEKATYITGSDIQQVLKATTKIARKVAFLICVYCKQYGSCNLGYHRIEEIVGASDKAAYRAIKLLTELGIVTVKSQGGMIRSNGNPILQTNKYLFVAGESVKKTIQVKFDIDNVVEKFDKFYYEALWQMCDERVLKKHLTGTEIKMMEETNEGLWLVCEGR